MAGAESALNVTTLASACQCSARFAAAPHDVFLEGRFIA